MTDDRGRAYDVLRRQGQFKLKSAYKREQECFHPTERIIRRRNHYRLAASDAFFASEMRGVRRNEINEIDALYEREAEANACAGARDEGQ